MGLAKTTPRAGTAGAIVLHVLLQKGWTVNPHNLHEFSGRWFRPRVIGDTVAFLIVAVVIASDDWYYTIVRTSFVMHACTG